MSPQKSTKNRKHQRSKISSFIDWSLKSKVTILTILGLVLAYIAIYNPAIDASEENTPDLSFGNVNVNEETRIISIPLCNNREKSFKAGRNKIGFVVSLIAHTDDGNILDLGIQYPKSEVGGGKCENAIGLVPNNISGTIELVAHCQYTGDALLYECSKDILAISRVNIPSIYGKKIIIIDASAKDYDDAKTDEYFDNIRPTELKKILEKKGGKVIIMQAPGKSDEFRNGMVLNENNRAVIFSNLNLETQALLNDLVINTIDELSNIPLHKTIQDFQNPEGETGYGLLLDLIGNCKINYICDSDLDFDNISRSGKIPLFGSGIVKNDTDSVIILPTTNSRQKK